MDPHSDGDLTSCSAEWASDEDEETEARLQILLRDAFQPTGLQRRIKRRRTTRRLKIIGRLRPPRQAPEANANHSHEFVRWSLRTAPVTCEL